MKLSRSAWKVAGLHQKTNLDFKLRWPITCPSTDNTDDPGRLLFREAQSLKLNTALRAAGRISGTWPTYLPLADLPPVLLQTCQVTLVHISSLCVPTFVLQETLPATHQYGRAAQASPSPNPSLSPCPKVTEQSPKVTGVKSPNIKSERIHIY